MSAPPSPPYNPGYAPATSSAPSAPAGYPPPYASGYGYAGPPTTTPPRKSSAGPVALLVIGVVLLLFVALTFAGFIPFLFGTSSSSSSGSLASYSEASAAAQKVADSYSSDIATARTAGFIPAAGDWIEVLSIGYALHTSISETGPLGAGTSCTITPFGSSASLTIPATSGSVSSGLATTWLFEYFASGDPNGLYVVWQGGSATAWGSFNETACIAQPPTNYEVPSGVIDSTTATGDAQANSSAFLSSNSDLSSAYLLVGGTTGATWDILYTTCTFGAATTGSWYSTFVNGLSGGVIFSISLSESCDG